MPQAGVYRHRLTFQTPTDTQNESNEIERTWADWFTVWARVSPSKNAVQGRIPGEEGFTGDRYTQETPAVAAFRWSRTVEERLIDSTHSDFQGAKLRMTFRNRTFEVYGIYPDDRLREVTVLGSEILAGG